MDALPTSPGPMAVLQKIGTQLAVVTAVISGLSAVAGAAWSLWEFAQATHTQARTARIQQLTTYGSFGEFLKQYHQVEATTERFLAVYRAKSVNPQALLVRYRTGSAMYLSPELADFRAVHQFYEELGTLIRFGVVDFEVAFELITFPSDFYEETAPLREFLAAHWFELRSDPAQRALKDFGYNLRILESSYAARRRGERVDWFN